MEEYAYKMELPKDIDWAYWHKWMHNNLTHFPSEHENCMAQTYTTYGPAYQTDWINGDVRNGLTIAFKLKDDYNKFKQAVNDMHPACKPFDAIKEIYNLQQEVQSLKLQIDSLQLLANAFGLYIKWCK